MRGENFTGSVGLSTRTAVGAVGRLKIALATEFAATVRSSIT